MEAGLQWGQTPQAWRGDQERNVDVFLVQLKCMAEVAVVLAEGFAVIAEDDPHRALVEPARGDSIHQVGERRIGIAKSVAIAPELISRRQRRSFGRLVGMMAGDGKVSSEETIAAWQGIDPAEQVRDGRSVVDAEARLVVAADVAGVRQHGEAPVADQGVHAQISETARMKQPGVKTVISEV